MIATRVLTILRPLLLSAVWLTTAGLIYNPGGAWLHDKVNSRRGMFMVGIAGCLVTTACLCAMIAQYAGTTNRVGNGFGIFGTETFAKPDHLELETNEIAVRQLPRCCFRPWSYLAGDVVNDDHTYHTPLQPLSAVLCV